MITVAVLLSGPHRRGMLETALASIPFDSPSVGQVLIRHQGGPWNWGGELRERMEAHPKVRVIEFPDRVDFAHSFNRTLDAIETPWAMLLPDDDYLVRPAAKAGFEAVAAHSYAEGCGLAIFGWYYLKAERFVAARLRGRDLPAVMRHTPKFCSTLLNLRRVRELGGFPDNVGGLLDTALFGRLAYRDDALISETPVGVYRMHSGQESAQKLPAQHIEALRTWLLDYARSQRERQEFERHVAVAGDPPSRFGKWLDNVGFRVRSRSHPRTAAGPVHFRKWSE